MRGTFELRRILLVANLVLLAIFVYMMASLVFVKGTVQEYAINSKPEAATAKVDQSSNFTSAGDHRIILERNIFGSAEVDTVKKEPQKDKLAPGPPKPVVTEQLKLRLLGTVAGDDQVACAVIEDITNKVQDLYRIGDTIQGARIDKIEQNRIVLHNEGRYEVLNISLTREISAPGKNVAKPAGAFEPGLAEVVKITSPTERQIDKQAFLAKVGGMDAVLNRVKLSPYVVDGEEKGIRINGLENISLARYVGFENGDVIQTINGQKLTNRRKAFQVLQKARALSTSDIQLLRGAEIKSLSFAIDSGK